MTKETKEIIEEKLLKLEEATSILEKFKNIPEKEFVQDQKTNYATMYALILGIESICDIGSHILSYHFQEKVATYKDTISLLAKHQIIPNLLKTKSIKMTDFRNVLIHIYVKIDLKEVHKSVKEAPKQFRQYAKYFQKFLDTTNK